MGVDMTISLHLSMCPDTGKPYHYRLNRDTNRLEKVYSLPDLEVPPELKKYLVGSGRVFRAYIDNLTDDTYEAPMDLFLDSYPSWEKVKESDDYPDAEEYWTEEDHNNFKRLIEWCNKQDVYFYVSWSY